MSSGEHGKRKETCIDGWIWSWWISLLKLALVCLGTYHDTVGLAHSPHVDFLVISSRHHHSPRLLSKCQAVYTSSMCNKLLCKTKYGFIYILAESPSVRDRVGFISFPIPCQKTFNLHEVCKKVPPPPPPPAHILYIKIQLFSRKTAFFMTHTLPPAIAHILYKKNQLFFMKTVLY